MAGHGDKRMRLQTPAIAALLSCSTIEEAAKRVGVSAETLSRWLGEPTFLREFKAAQRQIKEHAVGRLKVLSTKALDTLEAVMDDKEAPRTAKVSAARSVLENVLRRLELEDLDDRLNALEEAGDAADGGTA